MAGHAQASPAQRQAVRQEPPLAKVQYFSFVVHTDRKAIFFPLEISAFVKLTKMQIAHKCIKPSWRMLQPKVKYFLVIHIQEATSHSYLSVEQTEL